MQKIKSFEIKESSIVARIKKHVNSFIEELINPNRNRNNETIIIKRYKLCRLLNLRGDETYYIVDTTIK